LAFRRMSGTFVEREQRMPVNERRRFVRVLCGNVLGYGVMQEGGRIDANRVDLVRCRNISEGGVLFSSLEPFKKKTIIKMKVRIEADGQPPAEVTMIGEVARCDEVAQPGRWDVGIIISLIEKAKRDLFFGWLEKKLKERP
jgi:hypothetical protein